MNDAMHITKVHYFIKWCLNVDQREKLIEFLRRLIYCNN